MNHLWTVDIVQKRSWPFVCKPITALYISYNTVHIYKKLKSVTTNDYKKNRRGQAVRCKPKPNHSSLSFSCLAPQTNSLVSLCPRLIFLETNFDPYFLKVLSYEFSWSLWSLICKERFFFFFFYSTFCFCGMFISKLVVFLGLHRYGYVRILVSEVDVIPWCRALYWILVCFRL